MPGMRLRNERSPHVRTRAKFRSYVAAVAARSIQPLAGRSAPKSPDASSRNRCSITDVVNKVCVFGHLNSCFLAVQWNEVTLLYEHWLSKHVLEA